ncbi:trimeric intracellular cation channel family protein [bacterium]|nr:trimeric intracellular cation channel family protein [bacterium]
MLEVFNIIGLIAFAFSGAVKGIKRELDIFGITVLGLVTALGGGVLRDFMVARIPIMLLDPYYIGFSILGVLIAIFTRRWSDVILSDFGFLFSDAIGLSAFTITGALIAQQYNLGVIGIIMLGLSTAVGGGVIRDILVREIPLILQKEVYASCSILGATVFWLITSSGGESGLASTTGMLTTLFLRVVAIIRHWNLPRFLS